MKKRTLTLIMLLSLFAGFANIYCQSETDEAIKEAVVSLRTAFLTNDFKALMENHSFFERCLSAEPNNYLAKYYLAYIEYRLYSSRQAGSTTAVDKYYDTALDLCKELISKKQYLSEAKTILASLYMMRLAYVPMEAMGLAPQIMSIIEEAQQIDSENPRPSIIKGIMLMNMPPMLGGSVENSVVCLTAAVAMYEKNKKVSLINWGYEECQAWLGQALTKNNQPEKAKELYNKILKSEPDFRWVKYVLLPALNKKQ